MNSQINEGSIEPLSKPLENALSTIVISTDAEFEQIASEWNTLVEIADVDIFQTFEWQHTWWKYFGGNNRLHILLFRKGSQLVGIMPFFIDCFHVLGNPVYRCLKMIGSKVIQPQHGYIPVQLAFSDYLTGIYHPDYEKEILTTLCSHLNSNRKLFNEIIFDEVPEESPLVSELQSGQYKSDWKVMKKEDSICPIIQLPDSWDELLQRLSSNARYQVRRDLRKVTEDHIYEVETAQTRTEVEEAFQKLVDFHQARWNELGQPGIFTDQRILEFFREATFRLHDQGWLSLKCLTADGKIVAVDLLFTFKHTLYLIQRGFDNSPPYNEHRPGNVLLYYVIKEAIDSGFNSYDFLRGDESYKFRTANKIKGNKKLTLQNKSKNPAKHPIINEFFKKYAAVQVKISIEKHVLNVYLNRENAIQSLSDYFKNALQRAKKSITPNSSS